MENHIPKASILIVEDESIVAMDIHDCLEKSGYFIAGQADRGEDAVKYAQELSPDLVLMDIGLKGEMDGIEAAAQIRARFNLPVIFMTAFANQTTIERARRAEPYGYILKPFEQHELVIAIEMAVYKHSMEKKLRESEERYELAMRGANDGLWDWDLRNNEIYCSPRWKEMLGFKEDEIGTSQDEWVKRVHLDDLKLFWTNLASHLKGYTSHFECEYRIQHANGSYVWVHTRGLAVRDAEGKAYRMAGSQTDITARRLAEEQLAYGALHDGLTGLSNRELFMDRLGQKIEHTKRHPESLFAILFMDVDRFKVVNDSLGHTAGDQLLVAIGRRLQLCLRPEDTVSRLSGDEFAILLNEVNDINDAIRVAERIQARMRETTVLSAVNRSTTVSIGIAMFSDKYVQPQDMLRDADIAMYRAKALGGGRYETFSKDMHTQALALLQLEADLKRAVKNKEWLVYYQPIISMSSGEIAGVEALVRWNHPQRGILAPCEFIANAEESGVILAIDEYVLREACSQVLALQYAGHPELWVAVNISGRQFQDPNLPQTIKRILNETGLPGNCLRLEITEGVAMKDIEHSLSILKNLEKLDIQLTLDDFGTEYSSLSYLRRFPFKVMKIDRSFIQDITIDKNGEAITTAIISMGHSLNLTVVAEGVESTEQFSFLKKQFCDEVQGFLISKPMPSDELRKVFNGQSRYLIPKANDGWFRK